MKNTVLIYLISFLGIHAIVRIGNKLSYTLYNLSSGRVEQEHAFPSDTGAFMGQDANNVCLTSAGEGESIVLLRDGNRTLYPLARDSLDAIRDPHWLDLPPVRCLAAGLHPLSSGGSGGGLSASSSASSSAGPGSIAKTQVAVVVLVMDSQVGQPFIWFWTTL